MYRKHKSKKGLYSNAQHIDSTLKETLDTSVSDWNEGIRDFCGLALRWKRPKLTYIQKMVSSQDYEQLFLGHVSSHK